VRVPENKVLRRIELFVAKREEARGEERKLRSEKLHNLHSSPYC
jgi:hypothetical protein